MKYKNSSFVCKPYGVETVSELILRADVNTTCLNHLQKFRLQNPYEKYYAASILHSEQFYSVKGVDDRCMLFINSAKSYSEEMLEKGYARIDPAFVYKDYLLEHRFKLAVKRAKSKKSGIWSNIDIVNCFLLPPKK